MKSAIRVELDDKEIRDAIMEAARKAVNVQNPGSGKVKILPLDGERSNQCYEAVVEFQYQRAKQ